MQGENPKKPGKPHTVRLYSIASTRYGDDFDGKTASLCVRRAVYVDPETGKEDPEKAGICSNFLCNSKPGDKVQITGGLLLADRKCPVSSADRPSAVFRSWWRFWQSTRKEIDNKFRL